MLKFENHITSFSHSVVDLEKYSEYSKDSCAFKEKRYPTKFLQTLIGMLLCIPIWIL